MQRIRLAVLVTVTAGLLAACTGPSNTADPDRAQPPLTTVEPDPNEGIPDPTDTTEPEPAEVRVGETFTYIDGLRVAVVKVQRAPISEVASGGNRARHDNLVLTVKMTATKATSGELDITATLHHGADGREAEAVFDADGYGGVATDFMQEHPARLRKGRSLTGTFGFAVPKSRTEVVFTFNPGYDYQDATFIGRV
jgi:hypothetical protein